MPHPYMRGTVYPKGYSQRQFEKLSCLELQQLRLAFIKQSANKELLLYPYCKVDLFPMSSKPVCIIPARGGSKRIPRKNVMDFNGKPLIAWSIQSALESNIFARVIVSTDDEEIAAISRTSGAETPFLRDRNLADDFTSTADVLLDALDHIENAHYACCLYPTAPMVLPKDLEEAFKLAQREEADTVVSVTDFDFHPLRAFERKQDGTVQFRWPENALTRSQDLPEMFHDAGAFYFFNVSAFRIQKKLIMDKTHAYYIDRSRSVDIDNAEDFKLAQILHQRMQSSDEGQSQ